MTAWAAAVPAAVAVAAVAEAVRAGRRRWRGTTAVALLAVVLSLAVTVATRRMPEDDGPAWTPSLMPMLVEWLAFAVLIVLFLHRAPARAGTLAAAAAAVAMSALVLRLTGPPSWLAAVQACGLWALAAVPPAALGLLLRHQARRRAQVVAEARRGQRLQLARDLHDFVAHEVSEMIAVAQAGRVIGAADPAGAVGMFGRIEDAGRRAMATLDRTVRMLADADDGPGLADLSDLVLRFGAAGTVRATLDLEPALIDDVPPEAGAVAYRAVAEALTNVRRHAPTASAVRVVVRRTDDRWLTVTVINDRRTTDAPAVAARRGGRGLRGLRTAAEAAGGKVTFGWHGDGWRIAVSLPLAPVAGDQAVA
jgi:signal transduction histidine kinase